MRHELSCRRCTISAFEYRGVVRIKAFEDLQVAEFRCVGGDWGVEVELALLHEL